MRALLVGGWCRLRPGEDLLDRVADLVDLLQCWQEIDGSRRLPVVELLAVEVYFEPDAVGRGEGDRRFPIVDRGKLGRHTDGHRQVPSNDAVDDLDVNFAFGHLALLGDDVWHVNRSMSIQQRRCSGEELCVAGNGGSPPWPPAEVLVPTPTRPDATYYGLAIPQAVLDGEALTRFLDPVAPSGCPLTRA